jgi:NADPH-dependent ferric siderophore reductase
VTQSVRDPRLHVFLGGEGSDLPTLATKLAALPGNAYGQVFLVLGSDEQLPALPAPARVQLHLLRGERTSEQRAEAVATAALAWLREWMIGDPARSDREFIIWLGCGASEPTSAVDRLISDSLHDAHS